MAAAQQLDAGPRPGQEPRQEGIAGLHFHVGYTVCPAAGQLAEEGGAGRGECLGGAGDAAALISELGEWHVPLLLGKGA